MCFKTDSIVYRAVEIVSTFKPVNSDDAAQQQTWWWSTTRLASWYRDMIGRLPSAPRRSPGRFSFNIELRDSLSSSEVLTPATHRQNGCHQAYVPTSPAIDRATACPHGICTTAAQQPGIAAQRMRLDQALPSALMANTRAATKTGKQANAAAKAALRGVSLP